MTAGKKRRKWKQLTAGEDQLPHESAKVTSGSDHSNPNALRAFISSFLAALGHVFQNEKEKGKIKRKEGDLFCLRKQNIYTET